MAEYNHPERAEFIAKINAAWVRRNAAYTEVAKLMLNASLELKHTAWEVMTHGQQLPFTAKMARKLLNAGREIQAGGDEAVNWNTFKGSAAPAARTKK
jgi:hypothetical protein